MSRGQGRLSEGEVNRIISLLAKTELTTAEIARRVGRSKSAVSAINKKFKIRQYSGRRTAWIAGPYKPSK